MPDLFIYPDERFLLAKWDHLVAVFRIVARDYTQVLTGVRAPDRHRTILIQTVSDLLDLEADLFRLGKDSPALKFEGERRVLWGAAADWVRELRTWRFPHEAMPVDDIEDSLLRRKLSEERFNATLADQSDGPTADPIAVVCSS